MHIKTKFLALMAVLTISTATCAEVISKNSDSIKSKEIKNKNITILYE